MTWPNLDDATAQLERHGLLLGTEKNTRSGIPAGQLWINTSKPINVKASGAGKRGGWYWLSEKQIRDGLYITGAFGIYEGADPGKQSLKINFDKKAVPLTPEERAAIRARQDAQAKHVAALRKQEIERAAAKASHVWRQYVPAGESEYLKRKAVAAHGLRFSPSGNGTIAVPMLRAHAGAITWHPLSDAAPGVLEAAA
jgi:putative DNA primase/helicase